MSESKDQRTDDELGHLFGRGTATESSNALDQLLRRHESQLREDAFRLCGGKHADADDLFQNFSLHLLKKYEKFDPELGHAWIKWARAVLRGCASGERRKKRTRDRTVTANEFLIEFAAATSPPPSTGALQSEFGEAFKACFGELSDELQKVVILRVSQGCTLEQTAGILGLGKASGRATSRWNQAIKQLRKSLKLKGVGLEEVASGMSESMAPLTGGM